MGMYSEVFVCFRFSCNHQPVYYLRIESFSRGQFAKKKTILSIKCRHHSSAFAPGDYSITSIHAVFTCCVN